MSLPNFFRERRSWFSDSWPLLLLAFIVGLQHSWLPGMFPDGHLYMSFGKNVFEKGAWLVPHLNPSTYPAFTDHIPFIFILEGLFFKVFGLSYSSARFFSFLFFLGTFFYLTTFLKDKKRWAWWAGFLFIAIPPLIKKMRFPGLDLPLMFFSFAAFFYLQKALKESKNIYFYIGGLFWGGALLSKMPIAFFIPLGFFVYFITEKKFSSFKNIHIYLSMLLGLLIFSLWPTLLYFNGKFEIFEKYLYSTFVHTAQEARGVENSSPFTYLIFLLKQTPHFFILIIFSIKLLKKDFFKVREIKLSFVFTLSFLIPMSFMSFKYSHYLIPIYPFWAVLASSFFLAKDSQVERWLKQKGIPALGIIACLVLLIFPLTTKSSRDPELVSILHRLKKITKKEPSYLAITNHLYPFFNAANLFSLWSDTEIIPVSSNLKPLVRAHRKISIKTDENWAYLTTKQNLNKILSMNPSYKVIDFFPEKESYLVLDKSLIKNGWKDVSL